MGKDNFLKALLMVIWIVCLFIVYFSLKYENGFIALIGITAPYYLTKFYIQEEVE